MSFLLIITTEGLKDCFGDYIRFKQSVGFTVELRTVENGAREGDVQNILEAISAKEGAFFVLIGGLIGDVPSKSVYKYVTKGDRTKDKYASDSAYNMQANFCKYYIGRFPTNNPEEMILLCNNAIRYSTGSTSENKIMLISGDDSSEANNSELFEKYNPVIGHMIKLKLVQDHNLIIEEANNWSLICFLGHGSEENWFPDMHYTYFNPFSNRCHMIGLCCSSCQYNDKPTFGPKLLIQKNLASYLGASSDSYVLANQYLEYVLLEKYKEGYSTIGEIYLKAIYDCSFTSGGQKYGFWTNNLMGDPTLPF